MEEKWLKGMRRLLALTSKTIKNDDYPITIKYRISICALDTQRDKSREIVLRNAQSKLRVFSIAKRSESCLKYLSMLFHYL